MKNEPDSSSHVAIRRLFLRAMGLVYLIAFTSLQAQVDGLFGSEGLAPIANLLATLQQQAGNAAFLEVPSVLWWNADDAALRGFCVVGAIAGICMLFGVLPLPSAFLCWALYLSFVGVGSPFLRFQWDSLLLEAGFLALLWSPGTLFLGSRSATEPSRIVLWLLRFLLFRLVFFSGFVKLASGDPAWWDLTGLIYHYWTQPLPAFTAWYADKLPLLLQKLSCAIMFVIELGLPFAILFGRRPRLVAFFGFVFLQLLIAATGNYGFFNLLTAILCLPLLDDNQLGWFRQESAPPEVESGRARQVITALAAFLILAQSAPLAIARATGWQMPVGIVRQALLPIIGPLQLSSPYGLFASMTRRRPEITIEARDTRGEWAAYEFRWKPGPPARRPGFIGPGMPRLDWQMWFDALALERALQRGTRPRGLITPALLEKLKQAQPAVLNLLESSPTGMEAPSQLRWRLWQYRFTNEAERHASGAWWKRELVYTSAAIPGENR